MILQNIVNIAAICAKKGVGNIFLSPGSRCAPLTLAFVRHPEIKTRTISDERSAAFIGMGMAQKTGKPVGLVCTSGSAAYNYAPAVAEAYYQHIPLIIFTADRPPEWIDQLDGQTIRQREIYGKHVKGSFELPVDTSKEDASWYSDRIISEAINLANTFPAGPVHINVPVREPFYPQEGEEITFDNPVKVIDQLTPEKSLSEAQWQGLSNEWIQFDRKVIIAGQGMMNESYNESLNELSNHQNIAVLGDILSNTHPNEHTVRHLDIFLGKKDEAFMTELRPELIITFGRSVISKNLKLFLRKYKPKAHWHIQEDGHAADTFQSLTKVIPVKPSYFFKELMNRNFAPASHDYFQKWIKEEQQARIFVDTYPKNSEFGEFSAIKEVLSQLPGRTDLHLANSMSVRYVNFLGLNKEQNKTEVFANRGTSGIDGSNSTAVGNALATDKMTVLITGDMAFFYDRNAFWNNYLPENLRIVLLNNHAGGIFRMIDGPSKQPELEEYFETQQLLNASHTAKDFGMDYLYCDRLEQLQQHLKDFFRIDGKAKILEIETDSKTNKRIFNDFKNQINNHYGK